MEAVAAYDKDAIANGGIVIACGMAKYKNEDSMEAVFMKADKNMYDNKSYLKEAFWIIDGNCVEFFNPGSISIKMIYANSPVVGLRNQLS